MSVFLASSIIGFISFSVTLLTLLGVYSDLVKTLRSAPNAIPLALGNLREEIQYEQLYLHHKTRAGDRYDVFPDHKTRGRRKKHEFMNLLDQTIRHLWREFCEIEKPFIVKGETPWSLLQSGENGELGIELDEKFGLGSRRRRGSRPQARRESYRKNRIGMIEAGLSSDRSTYYRTDLGARFAWWWRQDDIKNLSDQLQRIQIRRIERDVFEIDELVRRSFSMQCRLHGWDSRNSGGSSDEASSSEKRANRRMSSGSRTPNRRRSARTRNKPSSLSPGDRKTYEREVIRRRPRSMHNESVREAAHQGARGASRPRATSVVYEYEVVNPGAIHVEQHDSQPDYRNRHRDREYRRSPSREYRKSLSRERS